MSKKHMVVYEIDLDNPPPLTAKQKAMLAALDKLPDEEIDLSDMPELDPNLYRPARPLKKTASVRFDADVLAWLRSFGKGYQTRMNAILRREMLSNSKPTPRKRAKAATTKKATRHPTRRGQTRRSAAAIA